MLRVPNESRKRVYLRLAQLAPPPSSVSEGDVMGLNREKLKVWKQALSASW